MTTTLVFVWPDGDETVSTDHSRTVTTPRDPTEAEWNPGVTADVIYVQFGQTPPNGQITPDS